VAFYAWGLGSVSNNIVEAYALWAGLRLAKDMGILKLSILGDSMLVIRALIKRNIVGNNIFIGIMSHTLALLSEFEEYSLYHIKHEHNSCDRWAKEGTSHNSSRFESDGLMKLEDPHMSSRSPKRSK
jgi:ribonuclease HI